VRDYRPLIMRDRPDARELAPQLIENINAIVMAKIVVMALIVVAKTAIMAMTLWPSHTSPNNNTRIS
jgi:hypothetical protein